MDKTKLIENIKNQLKSLMASEVKFAEIKAGDLMISSPDEELIIGSEVFTVDQDGNNIPLGDGDYTLDSGETITVVSGKVEAIAKTTEEVVEAGVEIEIEPEEEEEEETETESEDPKEEDMKTLAARVDKLEAMLEEMSKSNNKMAQELSKVSGEPSKSSIAIEPTEFKSVEEKKEGSGAVDIMAIRERARKNR